jgi:hypothetical protein
VVSQDVTPGSGGRGGVEGTVGRQVDPKARQATRAMYKAGCRGRPRGGYSMGPTDGGSGQGGGEAGQTCTLRVSTDDMWQRGLNSVPQICVHLDWGLT